MKKTLFALFTTLVTSVFAEPALVIKEPTVPSVLETQSTVQMPVLVTPAKKQGFFYARFAAGERNLANLTAPVPGLGLGYRRLAGDGAVDISLNGIGSYESQSDRYFWTAPKASYYHYLQPNADKSVYVGGGLAWGGIAATSNDLDENRDQGFVGIIPSVTVGYEFAHKAAFLGFTEFTLSQPALAVARQGTFPRPMAEVSVGVGF